MNTNRQDVAREAARLLYYHIVEEYSDAKILASNSLGIKVLPSNFEVARKLDNLVTDVEGNEREKLLISLREEAIKLMICLSLFQPRLIGSVWRGTARKGSDIDIQVFATNIDEVQKQLSENYHILKSEWVSKTSDGETNKFYHIFIGLQNGVESEIVVRNIDNIREMRKDAIYGDNIIGINIDELKSIIRNNPLKRFVPEKKKGRRMKK